MTRKGYGNHPFLYRYIRQQKPSYLLEIGVADGENAEKMIKEAKKQSIPIHYFGFDKFKDNSKEKIKNKLKQKDVKTRLIRGDTKNTLPKAIDDLPKMDLVFIDGGHDYKTVNNDWNNVKKIIKPTSAVFFHNHNFKGVKETVNEIDTENFNIEILDPIKDYKTAFVSLR